ncbi:hypothetical protein SALBM217S_04807 [Streptomyces griseoloalbus]
MVYAAAKAQPASSTQKVSRGVVTAVRTAIRAQRSPIGRTIMRRTQTVQPTRSRRPDRAAAGPPAEPARPSAKEKSITCRQDWRIMAPSARAQTSSPSRAAPRARPA